MTILGAFRDWLPARDAAANPANDGDVDSAASLPFDGYDGVETRQLTQELSDHSQIELEAVEIYERTHRGRDAVLDKLRYLRGPEPLPGYDALGADEILAALGMPTWRRSRGCAITSGSSPSALGCWSTSSAPKKSVGRLYLLARPPLTSR